MAEKKYYYNIVYTNAIYKRCKKSQEKSNPHNFLIKCQQQKWEKLPKLINNVG